METYFKSASDNNTIEFARGNTSIQIEEIYQNISAPGTNTISFF